MSDGMAYLRRGQRPVCPPGESGLPHRTEARMMERALAQGWVSPTEGRQLVERMIDGVRNAPTFRDRAISAPVVVTAALRDLKERANAVQERQGETQATLAALRAVGQSPKGRALLGELSELSCRQGAIPGEGEPPAALPPPPAADGEAPATAPG
jgi:hypothetical protein